MTGVAFWADHRTCPSAGFGVALGIVVLRGIR